MSSGWRLHKYDYEKFGKMIQEYRMTLRWSLEKLSHLVNINKGSLSQVEKGIRSLPESERRKLVDIFSEALDTKGLSYNRREFLASSGLLEARKSSTKPQSTASSLIHGGGLLQIDLATAHVLELRYELYSGRLIYVMEAAKQWYDKLANMDWPENDPYFAKLQILYGLLLGEAREAGFPWYQRGKASIRTYNDVENRIIERFTLNRFSNEYARLQALRARQYREQGQFDRSIAEFDSGLSYTEDIGDPFLKAALLRDRAHIFAVRGDRRKWEDEIEGALKHAENTESSIRPRLIGLVKDAQGNGYRRLAYNPRKALSKDQRKKYAELALTYLKESEDTLGSWDCETPAAGPDGHPYVQQLSRAQCLVWINAHEAQVVLEKLRPKAVRSFRSLLGKIDTVNTWAEQLLNWSKGTDLPVLDDTISYVH